MTLLNLPKMALLILFIEVGNAEFHYCRVDERAEEGNPVAHMWSLGWTCMGLPERKHWRGARAHISRTLSTRESNINVRDACSDVDHTLKRFWEKEGCCIEKYGTVIFIKEESNALKKLKEKIS